MADYSEIVRQMKREELQGSLYVGARQSPDTEAKLQRLADRWGVPVDSVRRNQPEVELQDRLRSFDYEKVIRDSPKLSTWLADPKNAAVAHDDYENLSRIEKLLTTGRDYAGAVGQGVIGQGFGSLLSGAGELYGVATRSFERGLGLVLPKSAMDALTAKVLPWWTDPGQVLKRPGQTLKDIGTAIGPSRERQSLGTDVASGIGQLGFQIAAFMMTGGTSSTTMMFAQGADVMADKTAKDKADPMMRDIAIVGGGAITAITEKYGLDKILNRVPPQIKNRVLRFIADKVAAGGIEAGQEIAEGLLHDLTRRLLTNRDAEILQGVDREASAAALSAAIVRSALGVRGFRQAQQTEDFFRALGDESKSAKLRERLPERFQALIDRYTEDGPVKEVMIPAKQFTEYFQSVGMDPAQIAAQAGARNYADALLGGTDVVIPMAGFMTTIAPTDHLQGLSQDLRLAQDENTPREMKQAEANRPEAERRLREELAAINEAAKSDQNLDVAIQRVIADVEGQLTSRYDQQTARAIATTMRGVAVLANRANPTADPLQAAQALWEKYGLTVDPLAQRGGGEAQGQPGAQVLNANGQQMGQGTASVSLGGRDIPITISAHDARSGFRLVNVNTAAFDAGFKAADDPYRAANYVGPQGEGGITGRYERFGEFQASASSIEAPTVSVDEQGRVTFGNGRHRFAYMRDNGVTQIPVAMDEESAANAVAAGYATPTQALNQPFNGPEVATTPLPAGTTEIEVDGVMRPALNSEGRPIHWSEEGVRNFWRWFGDSKNVDADGRPLVVYHSTNAISAEDKAGFSVFDTKISELGSHFGTIDQANSFGNSNRRRLMPAYLSIKNPLRLRDYGSFSRMEVPFQLETLGLITSEQEESIRGMAEKDALAEMQRVIRAAGYDGVVYLNRREGAAQHSMAGDNYLDEMTDDEVKAAYPEAQDSWIALNPTQIKSATGNSGAFDPANPSILMQSAYHGTPHRGIQKFSTDKIGTGEGAQAYGWGLYFASLRDVAEWYRRTLTDGANSTQPYYYIGGLNNPTEMLAWRTFLENFQDSDYTDARDIDSATLAGWADILDEDGEPAAAEFLRSMDLAKIGKEDVGQLYEVEIPEDSEMLLWDKPLSEQPEGVRAALAPFLSKREQALRDMFKAFPAAEAEAEIKRLLTEGLGQSIYEQIGYDLGTGDRGASEYLLSLGIKGIKYLDGTSRGAGDGSYNYVVFSGDDVAIKNQFYQGDQQARGQIRIAPDRKMNVKLFENADLSTFLHESGHFYLEVMGDLAEAEGTSQQVKDDYARILKFLGVNSRSEIRVEHHEKWARANEAYLMEGKAPAAELNGVFQRFRAWLKLIYRELSRLNVTLTDEVRGVMDRIYATDAEIARAEAEANFTALLLDAKTAGMTDAEFEVYRKAVAETTVEAKEELQTKLMRIEKLKREAWWREELAKVAEEVGKEYDATVVAQAFERMVAKDSAERLNRQQIIDRYGEDVLKRLPRGYKDGKGAVYAADGQDIDATAEAMGFGSADEMIASLQAMPNRARHIAAEANARMMERHGDLLNSVALADEAMAALHNEKREQVLKIELRALNKQIGGDLIPDDMLRGMAEGIIGQKEIRDLNPYAYLVAGRKAGREAFEQMAEGGNRMTAFRAKQQELLNHYMYLAALRAKKETDGIIKYLRGFEKTTTRQKLGKAGADYLDQIDAILERYELKNVSLKALGKREALAAWLLEQENQGNAVAVPQEIQDESRRVNWRQIPVDELRAVRDSVKNIAHLANLKNKLLRKGKQLEFETVVAELLTAPGLAQMGSTGDLSRPNQKGATVRQSGARAWRKFDAAHIKIEQLVEWLDGGKIDGPWARYFFDLADAAQTMEYDLHAKVTTKIEQISKSMPKAWREGIFDSTAVRLPGFDGPMTRYDLLSIAMNMGNAQNIQRLKDGYQWTDAHLDTVRNALTSTDWTFVQNTWDALELLWPEMTALEERHSGLPPEKVAPMPFTAAGLNLRGGYFPLVYDPRFSGVGEKQANEAESVQNFMAQGYGRASTNRGATKQRVETLKAGPLLDYEQIITSHLSKVIKDISHREAVIGINKILMQEDVKRTLIDKIGEADYLTMRQWLQTLVMDRADTLHQATGPGAWLMKARTNMAIVTMGWKISTMMAQFAGFTPVLDFVKPQYLTKALIQSVTSPQETWAMISQKSGEMRNRANTIERDARDALLRMRGEGGMLADVRRTAFFLTAYADKAVSVPAWLGAYQQALAEGKSEEDAIRAGDRAVRLSQGAGGAKDLSRVQNSNELMRLLTMYYTPFNVLYARLRDVGHQTAVQGIGYLPKAVARLTALVMIPAVLGDLLAGRGPDDDEDEVWWAIRKTLLYPVATIPVVRDMAGYLEAALIKASGEGEMKFPPSYKLSPVMGAIEKVARLPGKIADAATGEKPVDDVVFDTVETSGYVLGLPTSQVRITGEYLWDLLTGQTSPDNAVEIMRDALFRREQK